MALKIKDKELKAILKEVEEEVAGLLKAETDRLAKAADEDGGESEGGGGDSAPGAGEASAGGDSAPAEGSASADPSEGSASAPGPADASPAPEGAAPADPAAEGSAGPIDPESLKAEYASLPPEELKVHYLACKAALAEAMGGADPDAAGSADPAAAGAPPAGPEASAMGAPPAGPAAGAPPMPPPGPEASAPAPGGQPPMPPPAMKAEIPASMKNLPANGGAQRAAVPDNVQGGKVAKSEKALETLTKAESKIKELEQQIEGLTKAVELALTQPQRKAVTSVAFLGKGEAENKPAPTKAEIKEKLAEAVKNPKLTKSDRERIISYSVGSIGYEQIKDLLEKK